MPEPHYLGGVIEYVTQTELRVPVIPILIFIINITQPGIWAPMIWEFISVVVILFMSFWIEIFPITTGGIVLTTTSFYDWVHNAGYQLLLPLIYGLCMSLLAKFIKWWKPMYRLTRPYSHFFKKADYDSDWYERLIGVKLFHDWAILYWGIAALINSTRTLVWFLVPVLGLQLSAYIEFPLGTSYYMMWWGISMIGAVLLDMAYVFGLRLIVQYWTDAQKIFFKSDEELQMMREWKLRIYDGDKVEEMTEKIDKKIAEYTASVSLWHFIASRWIDSALLFTVNFVFWGYYFLFAVNNLGRFYSFGQHWSSFFSIATCYLIVAALIPVVWLLHKFVFLRLGISMGTTKLYSRQKETEMEEE